jgi:hypothetical protein
MIEWKSAIEIQKPPDAVFEFLANVPNAPQPEGSPVALEMTTPGPPGLGSQYREVVRMLPFYHGEFRNEYTVFEPPWVLEIDWTGPAMSGRDRYELAESPKGTTLVHSKRLACPGLLRVIEPLLRRPLIPRLEGRLVAIKRIVEEQPE